MQSVRSTLLCRQCSVLEPRLTLVVTPIPFCMQDKAAVEIAIKEAEEKCAGGGSAGECAAAWDNVSVCSIVLGEPRPNQQEPIDTDCLLFCRSRRSLQPLPTRRSQM